MCLCVRKRGGLWLWPCIYQPCCRLQCVTVKREPGPQGHPTGIKTAISVGRVSQWASRALRGCLVNYSWSCLSVPAYDARRYHCRGGDKTRSKIGATCCNKSARNPHKTLTAGAQRQRRFVLSHPTCKCEQLIAWRRRKNLLQPANRRKR